MDNFLAETLDSHLTLKSNSHLPSEVLEKIIEFTNIGHITILLVVLRYAEWTNISNIHIEDIRHRRMNPILYLSKLVNNPLALLTLMRNTGTVLSGSRALEYFVPGSCTAESDWDFYCHPSPASTFLFAQWSGFLGINWEFSGSKTASTEDIGDAYDSSLYSGYVETKNAKYNVQLVFGRNLQASHQITKFHSTAVQCCISGFAAISLYHSLTLDKTSIGWIENALYKNNELFVDPRILQGRISKYEAIKEKYMKRGFKYKDYRESIADLRIRQVGSIGGRQRYISDSETCMVSFRTYINTNNWKHDFYEYIDRLSYIRWYDFEDRTFEDTSLLKALQQADRNVKLDSLINDSVSLIEVIFKSTVPISPSYIRNNSRRNSHYKTKRTEYTKQFKDLCNSFNNALIKEQRDANIGQLTDAKYAILMNAWNNHEQNMNYLSIQRMLLPY